jgi:hypothetical protein
MKVIANLIALTLPDAKPAQITPVLYMASLYIKTWTGMGKMFIVNYKDEMARRLANHPLINKMPCPCGC